MKNIISKIMTVTMIVSLGFAFSACTNKNPKKRADTFAKGEGQNLIPLSEIEGKTFSIETGNVIGETSVNPSSTQLMVKKGQLAELPLVITKMNTPHLKDKVSIRGKPNHKYLGAFSLNDNILEIYKIGNAEDIDKEEAVHGKALTDGKVSVPLMSYNVEFIKIEKAKNADGEAGNLLKEAKVEKSKATHIRLLPNTLTQFELAKKEIVLPASYFAGNWTYTSKVNVSGTTEVQKFETFSFVTLELSENQLKVVNSPIMDSKNDPNEMSEPKIPLRWVDYELKREAPTAALKEVPSTSKKQNEKRFVELDLHKVEATNTTEDNYHINVVDTKLVATEFSENSFSFVVENTKTGVRATLRFFKTK